MELSQNLTEQLDSVLFPGSTPVSDVIGSDLQFLGDIQLSFTRIIKCLKLTAKREIKSALGSLLAVLI